MAASRNEGPFPFPHLILHSLIQVVMLAPIPRAAKPLSTLGEVIQFANLQKT